MKKFQLLFFCLICVAQSYGQMKAGRVIVEITKEKHKCYAKVIESNYSDSSWLRSFEANLNGLISDKKGIKRGEYIASVKFIVSKNGILSDVVCDKDPGYGLCEEVVRLIKKSPKWIPVAKEDLHY